MLSGGSPLIVYYLDASAWVSYYYQERASAWNSSGVSGSSSAGRLLFVRYDIICADLARKAKGREIDPSMLEGEIGGT